MKVVIGGSRTVDPTDHDIDKAWDDPTLDGAFVLSKVTAILCGMATGADLAGKRWAEMNDLPVIEMPVTKEDYKEHGGYLAPKYRNRRMAVEADAAILFWDGTSGGTSDMVCRMVVRGKPVKIIPMKAVRTREKRQGGGRGK